MNIELSSLNIILTGSSRGIGFAIGELLMKSGAHVALHYNKNKSSLINLLNKNKKFKGEIFQANLSNIDETINFFNSVVKKFGKIDVLINNAGIALNTPVDIDNTEWIKNWEQTIKVNLTSLAILCKLAINHFLKNEGGRIINIASRAAFRGDTPAYMGYAASKGGIVSLTRSIARGFGKHNIKAFTVAPGFVETDMAKSFMKEYGKSIVFDDISLPDLTKPKDIAPFIVFLASGLADHATGGTFDINAASYVH